MTFECWFAECERIFTTRDQLKNHVSNHGYLRVVCPWCSEDEKSKRRMVDHKRHVSECHVRVIADDERLHFLRERCGFFLAINPDDYKRAIGTPEEGPDISLSAVAAPPHSRKLTFELYLESPTKSPNTSSPIYHPKSPVEVPTCQPKSPVEVIFSADRHHTPLKSLLRPLQAPPSTQPLPKSLPLQLQAPPSTQPLPKSLPRQLQAPPSTQPLPRSLPRQLHAPPSEQLLPTSRTTVSPA
ncbi:hypothetical protein DPMN_089465 [Dreissena polymorpha]|uniref:C2H2-type domain-containing protein n=1 Tax=Dreissena polymorpha TaxID=45954 RepID=A0A9D4KWG9_DREPO|nr:hypothetical protein DPMN_084994 [Dreissena polymorpha]KAH3847150.1 hypothetical protein DPMN_089465 [Dreissena polymorpha]